MISSPKRAVDQPVRLVSPTPDAPWSIDVVSAIPKSIVDAGAMHLHCAGASHAVWHCLGCTTEEEEDGNYVFYVWFSPLSATLHDQKYRLPVVKLMHPTRLLPLNHDDNKRSSDPLPPLVAMQVSPHTTDTVYIYIANAETGAMLLWKLEKRDLERYAAAPPYTAIAFLLDQDSNSGETLTSLHVSYSSDSTSPVILAGTSTGRILWITQSNVPISLDVQLADPSSSKSGLLNTIWKTIEYKERSPIVAISHFPSTKTATHFFTTTEVGKIAVWQVTKTESYKAYFTATLVMDLKELLRDDESISGCPTITSVTALKMALGKNQLHVLTLTTDADGDARLYWIRINIQGDGKLTLDTAIWLNRFVAPELVQVIGFLVADNGITYGVFRQDASLASIAMALDAEGMLHELDMPTQGGVSSLLHNTMAKSVVDFGFTLFDASGVGISTRLCIEEAQPVAEQRKRNPSIVPTLVTHLKSAFWDSYMNPDRSIRLPPSLTTAQPADLEEAVVAVAQKIQQRDGIADRSMRQNILERHSAYISLLKQSGIYRSLSSLTRWKLLAVGQEAAVFARLCSLEVQTSWEEEVLGRLDCCETALWLEQVQKSVLAEGGGEDRQATWSKWLLEASDASLHYREERAASMYDVPPSRPPIVSNPADMVMWTTSPVMLSIWQRQLSFWSSHARYADTNLLESLVQPALLSFADAYLSCPADATKEAYARVQKVVFLLLRQIKPLQEDELAFELCVAHRFFGGICKIAFDHERRCDREKYQLGPLFQVLANQSDISTGISFGIYVLKWHADRSLFGHVLQYGEYCPEALEHVFKHVQALEPYRWIHDVRQGNFDGATTSLMRNVTNMEAPLDDTVFALSAATLANDVVANDMAQMREVAKKRSRIIDKKRESANVQEELVGVARAKTEQMWNPSQLIDYALEQYERAKEDMDDQAHFAFLALVACAGCETRAETVAGSSKVWHTVIQSNKLLWQSIIDHEADLTSNKVRKKVREASVFGRLVEKLADVKISDEVSYGNAVEMEVFNVMGGFEASRVLGMKRLFRTLVQGHESSTHTNSTSTSIIVAEYE